MHGQRLGIRKIVYYSEEILLENGLSPAVPAVRATAAAVVTNPWLGGKATDDLNEEVIRLAPVLARKLTDVLARELGGVDAIEAFGKAAIVGTGGEIEHGAALMRTFVHEEGRLPHELAADLGRYRRRVFVEQLGWELPSANESFERDQFDRDDTVYVFARNAGGDVCGCARLLPTTRPYLLQSLFADLIAADMPLPQSAAVWELSRFAATDDEGGSGNAEWAVRPMLAAVVECAAQLGARQLIGVTFASMERLFRRIGIHAHRAGPPKQVDGRLVVACWIDIDPQTFAALGIKPGQAARQAIAA
ncbi:amino acid synthesis family protein [Burkholderia sp. LFS038]